MSKVYDIVIIGAGAAGLTSAIYARRANKSVLVIDSVTYGGQIVQTTRIENYPASPHISGIDFAKQTYDQAVSLGADFVFEEVTKIEQVELASFTIYTTENTYHAKTVIIATGSHERPLGLPHEDKFTGRGISYCATCDGGFFKNKTVVVNGGGNTALYSTLYLADIAKEVYLIHRRGQLRADPALINKVESKPNVKFILNANITALHGDKKLEKIDYQDSTGNHSLTTDGLFVTIGRDPSTEFIKDLITLDEKGYVKSDETCTTSMPGIFVAGDVRNKPLHQLVTATADGATAASAAIDYLND